MVARVLLLLVVLSTALGWTEPCAAGAQASVQRSIAPAALAPGPHAVGYRLVYVSDPSRTPVPDSTATGAPALGAPPPGARVLPVRLWYPAAAPGDQRRAFMRYGEYLETRPTAGARAPAVADSLLERTMGILRYVAVRSGRALGERVTPSDTAGLLARLLASRTAAVRGAPAAAGPFPVVVFAGGAYHSVDENVALWEHLASRGYFVAALPSVGVDGADLPADDAGLETMTRDVETVIAHLAREPQADRTRLAAAGFSFGGAAALVAAARNRWVDAVVGLDASFIAGRHADRVRGAAYFTPARVTVPILELHRADTTVDLSVVTSLRRAPRYSVEFTGIDHVDFNSYALVVRPLLPARQGPAYAARDSAVAARAAAYVAMVASITDFLDAYVSDTAGAEGRRAALAAALADDAPRWARVPQGRVRSRVLPAEHGSARRGAASATPAGWPAAGGSAYRSGASRSPSLPTRYAGRTHR